MPKRRRPDVPRLFELLAAGEFDVRDGRIIRELLDGRDVRGLRRWLVQARRLDAMAKATRRFVGEIADALQCSRADAMKALAHMPDYARRVDRQRDHVMADEWLLAMDSVGLRRGEVSNDRRELIARVLGDGKDRRDVLEALKAARARNRSKNPRRTRSGSR